MMTRYLFDTNTAEMLEETVFNGHLIVRSNRRLLNLAHQCAGMTVCEGITAEREFFAHFGDDSSWPPGWYAAVTEGKFTRESWTQENYPPSKVSWQEYFGVREFPG